MREALIVAPETHRRYYESLVAAYAAALRALVEGTPHVTDLDTVGM